METSTILDLDNELAELRRRDEKARELIEELRSHDWPSPRNLYPKGQLFQSVRAALCSLNEQAAKIAGMF